MGIENRDYLRGSSTPGSSFDGDRRPVGGMITKIVLLTVIVFVAQLLTGGSRVVHERVVDENGLPIVDSMGRQLVRTRHDQGFSVTRSLLVDFNAIVRRGEIWRLVTYAFCHAPEDLMHIVFNLWMLWLVGREMESLYGSGEILAFYLTAAVFASVCYLVLGFLMDGLHPMLGASGSVTAMVMLYSLHYPRRRVYLFGLIAVEMRFLMAGMLLWDLHPILLHLLQGSPVEHGVAHAAHLGGALMGWIYFARQMRLTSMWRGRRVNLTRPKSGLKAFEPMSGSAAPPDDVADLEEQVDRILTRISEQGEASLTPAERAILQRASRKIRGE